MPILPQEGEEEERGKKQKQEKDKRREQANARITKRTKKPPILVPGQRILTSKYSTGNQDNEKSVPGKVIRLRPNTRGRSAVIELNDGSTTVRNRRYCAIDPTEPQPDDSVNNIEGDDGHTCIKLIQKKEKGDDEVYLENRIQKLKARGAILGEAGYLVLVAIISTQLLLNFPFLAALQLLDRLGLLSTLFLELYSN